ncbi:SRPBCC family protein [Larkinella sp. VNQ87]|uniref:SRPBCC family protein n=1 Tax=Larkinella sp. VNQ87 TaxID=3400921 RepID=UPI003C0D1646
MKLIFPVFSLLLAMTATAQPTDHRFSQTDSTSASPDRIWRIWTDVPNWNQWDTGLKEARLEGDFESGTKGTLIPDRGPKSRFVISQLVPGQSYTFKTRIPFGWLVVKRSLKTAGGRTYFTHDVAFTGLLKRFWGRRLGRSYRAMLPTVLQTIKQLAETP